MTSEVPAAALLDLPAWIWGGNVDGFLDRARLVPRRDPQSGVVTVRAKERGSGDRPRLVRATEIDGPAAKIKAPFLGELEHVTLGSLETTSLVDPAVANLHLNELTALVGPSSWSALAAGFAAHQFQTMTATAQELDSALEQIVQDLREIRISETGEIAFPNASVHFVSRDMALLHRTRIASILLRLEHDGALRSANVQGLTDANARGEVVFASSMGHSEGVVTLEPYLGPLLGAMTPFVWGFPATRAAGTVIYALGSQVAGTARYATEPLHLLPVRGPLEGSEAPNLTARSAGAAIAWWVKRLDNLLGVISDPAVFSDERAIYVPSKHLHAQLSIEQVFRRTSSIQLAHRDADARRVLLFTTLDTLERVTSRTLTTMCTLSFAQRTLELLRGRMSQEVGALLLPAAERAVKALAELQAGFFLSRQLKVDQVKFLDTDGNPTQLSLEGATAEYLRVLRNATHGHGTNRVDAKRKTDALLAHHDGMIPHDLPLLSYLYLLDLLCEPSRLRRVLWNGGSA